MCLNVQEVSYKISSTPLPDIPIFPFLLAICTWFIPAYAHTCILPSRLHTCIPALYVSTPISFSHASSLLFFLVYIQWISCGFPWLFVNMLRSTVRQLPRRHSKTTAGVFRCVRMLCASMLPACCHISTHVAHAMLISMCLKSNKKKITCRMYL